MKRVLLVEDHRAFSDSFAMLLGEEPDIEVVGRVGSASECRRFAASGEKFDVAVVDLYLPDGEGIDLIGELRKVCPRAPVLVLTISLDPDDHSRAIGAGADKVLSKSTSLEEIVATVRHLGDE